VGLPGYQQEEPFAASLFVEIRKGMGPSVFDEFQHAIIDSVAEEKQKKQRRLSDKIITNTHSQSDDNEPPSDAWAKEPDK